MKKKSTNIWYCDLKIIFLKIIIIIFKNLLHFFTFVFSRIAFEKTKWKRIIFGSCFALFVKIKEKPKKIKIKIYINLFVKF